MGGRSWVGWDLVEPLSMVIGLVQGIRTLKSSFLSAFDMEGGCAWCFFELI